MSDICYTFNKSPYGDTPEKAVARTNDYIKSQMPRWKKEYFNPMPATPKPMSANANVSANTNTATSWGNFGTPNKNNMFTTSSGKSLKQNTWETLGGTKADSFDSFTPMKMPKPAPEPKVPQMMPMPQMPQMTPMPQMQTPTPWATGQMTMAQNILANLPKPTPQQIIQQRMRDYNNRGFYLTPNQWQDVAKASLDGLYSGLDSLANGASFGIYKYVDDNFNHGQMSAREDQLSEEAQNAGLRLINDGLQLGLENIGGVINGKYISKIPFKKLKFK